MGVDAMLPEEHKGIDPLDAIWIYSESDPDQAGTILERPEGTVSKGGSHEQEVPGASSIIRFWDYAPAGVLEFRRASVKLAAGTPGFLSGLLD